MNSSLKLLLTSRELCHADEAADVVMSLKLELQMEAWTLVLGREDVRRSFKRETLLLKSLLNDRKVYLPDGFYEFCSLIPALKDNLFLKAKMLSLGKPIKF